MSAICSSALKMVALRAIDFDCSDCFEGRYCLRKRPASRLRACLRTFDCREIVPGTEPEVFMYPMIRVVVGAGMLVAVNGILCAEENTAADAKVAKLRAEITGLV